MINMFKLKYEDIFLKIKREIYEWLQIFPFMSAF